MTIKNGFIYTIIFCMITILEYFIDKFEDMQIKYEEEKMVSRTVSEIKEAIETVEEKKK